MSSQSPTNPVSQLLASKWWTYQRERFPLWKNSISTTVFSLSAVCHSLLLRMGWDERTRSGEVMLSPLMLVGSLIIALLVLFLFAIQLRVATEYRDFGRNARLRSQDPVQRRLISLRELGVVAIAAAAIQLGLSLALKPALVLILGAVWLYLALLSQNFFVPPKITLNPLLYRGVRTLVMPLMGLYATACDWWVADTAPPRGLIWFLCVSFFAGLAIDIGRKIYAPKDEKRGVQTYTALWGRQKAVMAWLGVSWLTFLTSLLAARYIEFHVLMFLILLVLLTGAVIVAWQFMVRPVTAWAKRFELVSGIWAIAIYLGLGIIPLLLK